MKFIELPQPLQRFDRFQIHLQLKEIPAELVLVEPTLPPYSKVRFGHSIDVFQGKRCALPKQVQPLEFVHQIVMRALK